MTKSEAFDAGKEEFLKGNVYMPCANKIFLENAVKSKIDTATLIGEYYNGFMFEQNKYCNDIK